LRHPLGFDQQRAIQVEEFEEAAVQRAQALQRLARETHLQQILVTTGQHVDIGASTRGETGFDEGIIHGGVQGADVAA
jgi:hypothetical protein